MDKQAPRFYVNAKNRKAYDTLYWMKNSNGERAFSAHHLRILEYVGSFDPKAGCFASDHKINATACMTTQKTFSRNLSYLLDVGAVSVSSHPSGRVLRLSRPSEPPVPQCVYRWGKGITSYAYVGPAVAEEDDRFMDDYHEEDEEETMAENRDVMSVGATEDDAFFLSLSGEKLSLQREKSEEKLSLQVEKLSPYIEKSIDKTTKNNLEDHPLTPLSLALPQDCGHASRAREAAPTGRPCRGGLRPRQGEVVFNNKKTRSQEGSEQESSEPVVGAGPKKGPKNQQERMAEAAKLRDAGHVVNPLGRVDNRGRRLSPGRARQVGSTGGVTNASLYRYLVDKFDENGWHGVMEVELPPFRENVAAQFDLLRQKFIDSCGHKPDNRELYEYFEWFLEPTRLRKFLSSARRAGRDYPAWPQMMGTAYAREFYDTCLKQKAAGRTRAGDADVDKIKGAIKYIRDAFERMRNVEEDDTESAFCIGSYGFVLYAQYLHDEKSLDASGCKKRIIQIMVRFLKGAESKKPAMEFLRNAAKVTESNHKVNDDCEIWPEWRAVTADVVRTALEESGVHGESK
jgi:hypothetical protein